MEQVFVYNYPKSHNIGYKYIRLNFLLNYKQQIITVKEQNKMQPTYTHQWLKKTVHIL